MADARISHGGTLTFATSGFQANVLFKDVGFSATRGKVDVSHQGTVDWADFLPGALVEGEMTVSVLIDPAVTIPVTTDAETITYTHPDGGQASFSGFISDYTITGTHKEAFTADLTIAVTGELAFGTGSGSGSGSLGV